MGGNIFCEVSDFGLSRELAKDDETQAEYTTQVNIDFLRVNKNAKLHANECHKIMITVTMTFSYSTVLHF